MGYAYFLDIYDPNRLFRSAAAGVLVDREAIEQQNFVEITGLYPIVICQKWEIYGALVYESKLQIQSNVIDPAEEIWKA